MKICCKNCYHFRDNGKHHGLCFRYPPQWHRNSQLYKYPTVVKMEFCGEYKDKNKPLYNRLNYLVKNTSV